MLVKSKRIACGMYDVYTANGVYLVYRSEGLWWAKEYSLGHVVDSAPTKAELLRSLEAR